MRFKKALYGYNKKSLLAAVSEMEEHHRRKKDSLIHTIKTLRASRDRLEQEIARRAGGGEADD